MKKSYKCQLERLEDRALMSSSPLVLTTHPLPFMPKPSADKAVIAILAFTTDNSAGSVSIVDQDDYRKAIPGIVPKAVLGPGSPKLVPGVSPTKMAGPQHCGALIGGGYPGVSPTKMAGPQPEPPHAPASHKLSVDSVFAASSWEKVELLV